MDFIRLSEPGTIDCLTVPKRAVVPSVGMHGRFRGGTKILGKEADFPRTAAGKIQKSVLREQYWEGAERKI